MHLQNNFFDLKSFCAIYDTKVTLGQRSNSHQNKNLLHCHLYCHCFSITTKWFDKKKTNLYKNNDTFNTYINYHKFRTLKFRTFKFRTLNFGQNFAYFGRFRTNISDKICLKFSHFYSYFWWFFPNFLVKLTKFANFLWKSFCHLN